MVLGAAAHCCTCAVRNRKRAVVNTAAEGLLDGPGATVGKNEGRRLEFKPGNVPVSRQNVKFKETFLEPYCCVSCRGFLFRGFSSYG